MIHDLLPQAKFVGVTIIAMFTLFFALRERKNSRVIAEQENKLSDRRKDIEELFSAASDRVRLLSKMITIRGRIAVALEQETKRLILSDMYPILLTMGPNGFVFSENDRLSWPARICDENQLGDLVSIFSEATTALGQKISEDAELITANGAVVSEIENQLITLRSKHDGLFLYIQLLTVVLIILTI